MVKQFLEMMDRLPPFPKMKNPGLAAALGFAFGGIGLGIYLKSFIDLLFPLAIVLVASVMTGIAALPPDLGLLAGAMIAAMWGFFRVESSNRRLVNPA